MKRFWPSLTAVLTAAVVSVGGVLAVAGPARAVGTDHRLHWDFEDGTTQGWTAAAGSDFGPLITDRQFYHNNPTIAWNKNGRYFLSTEENAAGQFNDGYTGVVNSPTFTLTEPVVSALVGGGHVNTYLAACAPDPAAPHGCRELARTAGVDAEPFLYRTLDLSGHLGERLFLQVVDENKGGWGHLTVDDVRVNYPVTPQGVQTSRTARAVAVSWTPVAEPGVTGYRVYRSTQQDAGFSRVGAVGADRHTFTDRGTRPETAYFYRVTAVYRDGTESDGGQTFAYARPYQDPLARGRTVTYAGDRLSGIEFPVGPMGAGGILHFGDGTRNESWIFNHSDAFAPRRQGSVPNSFFAVRADDGRGRPVVRALQTTEAGNFAAARRLTFQGEYPLARYRFDDAALPVQVSESVSNPMIPGDLKNSAIPTAIYSFTLHNPSPRPVSVSLLASQQNAVGFDGVGTIGGAGADTFAGYGDNVDQVRTDGGRGQLSMTGKAGSMALSVLAGRVSGTASWTDNAALQRTFADRGAISGPSRAASPAAHRTVNGALASTVALRPGGSVTIPVVLSWNFPTAPTRGFGGEGEQYTNWWSDAAAVDRYVVRHRAGLTAATEAFHRHLYDSNLPHYVLDRLSSAISVLHSPSVFWAKNGFFGGWEGYGCCWGMPNHVWQYAQTASALWPQVGRMWTSQWLDAEQPDGLLPFRYDAPGQTYGLAFDGQAGVVLSAYRTYQQSGDSSWLRRYWPKIKGAMDYLITNNDPDRDGLLAGPQPTTLDSAETGTGSWLGSLYLAAVNASAHLARVAGDRSSRAGYDRLYDTGRTAQDRLLWNGSYYQEEPQSLPGTVAYGTGSAADMLLGQWWSGQLGLGDIYDSRRTDTAAASLFTNNYRSNFFGFEYAGRVYAEPTDPGLLMITWPHGGKPANPSPYYDETWTGTEYSAAAMMIQRGAVTDGLTTVLAAADRQDGRLRTDLTQGSCGTGDGGGNPFGDSECGQWYSRSMSSWSVLTALQGATWDGPTGRIAFDPKWRPADHRSFFTAGTASGTFSQRRLGGLQTDQLTVAAGALTLHQIALRTPRTARLATVSVNGRPITARLVRGPGTTATVRLGGVRVGAGDSIRVLTIS